jgi:hypothetical protein
MNNPLLAVTPFQSITHLVKRSLGPFIESFLIKSSRILFAHFRLAQSPTHKPNPPEAWP